MPCGWEGNWRRTGQWPRVTDVSGSPPTGTRPRRGRWAPAYTLLVEYGELYLYLKVHRYTLITTGIKQMPGKHTKCCRVLLLPHLPVTQSTGYETHVNRTPSPILTVMYCHLDYLQYAMVLLWLMCHLSTKFCDMSSFCVRYPDK